MFIVIVRHWANPGMLEGVRRRLDTNGDLMAQRPGFLYRHRIESAIDPTEVSTVTAWQDEASYKTWDQWKKARDASLGQGDGMSSAVLFSRAENHQYRVVRSHDPGA